MGKKLAVLFPGIGYSVDRPLLYYSKKVLKAKGYEIIEVNYGNLKADALFDSEIKKISRDKLISFVAKANELAAAQLGNVAFNKYDSIVFVSKSIGSQYLIHKLEKENPEYEDSSDIKWNFTKFLVDRKGNVIERFEPTTDLALVDEAIAKLL